ncbi:ZYRO0D14520p [Zygosaccharomyces rouxii]|uniref:ZYRO0D14520p n=1 Tax=Zygosaccharomyces rouxii (strain ATCC 2623 / CBS 732 / NBRC 1130 / NCYC 568 / NRRL Y-229) TaxID=559307 RepID=C5DWF9_ZYGRC|nr:uncharacterized protein ZYRO0D14520g [Zygosaccharomyces rouxii]KAH9201039.1 ClpP/crotonase-like domain-containing protein [Zygosaccharomyces rouxii]CAR28128.1 ZYRO0D14520p [Zygosaccharomyces rouxii]
MADKGISYCVDGPVSIISINKAKTLNSMSGDDYIKLAELVDKADNEPKTFFTLLQSCGSFFSSGADFVSITEPSKSNSGESELKKWLDNFLSRNSYVTSVFIRHRKILICCLNGPAVGLSAALCALCDIVYAMNDKVYLRFPFVELGLVMEGGTSVTLPLKLGNNKTMETILFNKNLTYDELKGTIVTRNYDMTDTQEFNQRVINDLKNRANNVYLPSILGIKKLISINYKDNVQRANSVETSDAITSWVNGEPQRRFKILKTKLRKHKV